MITYTLLTNIGFSMRIFITLTLFISQLAQADLLRETGKEYQIQHDKKLHLSFTSDCLDQSKCNSEKLLQLIHTKMKPISFPKSGGHNKGALICTLIMSSKVVIFIDAKGNQSSYCQVDKYYIDNGSLQYIYLKKYKN